MNTSGTNGFGARRIYYNNFAEHLQNAFNPNMFYPGLPNRWSDAALTDHVATVRSTLAVRGEDA